MIKIGVVGATGQLGCEIIRYIDNSTQYQLYGATVSKANMNVGKKVSSVISGVNNTTILSSDIAIGMSGVDVIIDCTNHNAFSKNLDNYLLLKKPLVIATTNIDDEAELVLRSYADIAPVCQSSNFSIFANDLIKLLGSINVFDSDNLDVYITEIHGRKKVDSPSGTAMRLKKIIMDTMGVKADIHSIRAGSVAGFHEITFINSFNERLVISLANGTRISYVHGIMLVCSKIISQEKGYYSLQDILNLR